MSLSLWPTKQKSAHPANNDHAGSDRARYYADLTQEHGFVPLRVEGELPKGLRGTLYRAGPATSGRFGRPYVHMFEGDGAVSAIRFEGGAAQGAVRFMRSPGFVAEERAGRPLFQSAAPPWVRLSEAVRGRSKNTANTAVMFWNETLYALMEAAGPLAFDPQLNTIGPSDLGGVVQGAFSAHPHRVHARAATYNFGVSWSASGLLRAYEMAWGGSAKQLIELKLDKPVMLHDFMATEKNLIFFVAPARFKLQTLVLGLGDASDFLQWHPEDGTEVIVVPIDEPSNFTRFKVPPFFQIHFGGGFEDGEQTVVDFFRYADSSAVRRNIQEIDKPPYLPAYVRARVDARRQDVSFEQLTSTGMEFGSVDERKCGGRFRYMFGMTIQDGRDGIVRVDTQGGHEDTFLFPHTQRVGEPTFVPRTARAKEGDGYVIGLVYDAPSHTSHWAVFDTRNLADGPICRCYLEHHIPAAFHGIFVPGK